jgi:hypothetical protein
MIRAAQVRAARKRYRDMAPVLNEQAFGVLSRSKQKPWDAEGLA